MSGAGLLAVLLVILLASGGSPRRVARHGHTRRTAQGEEAVVRVVEVGSHHLVDIKATFSLETHEVTAGGGAKIDALPCPHRQYLYTASGEAFGSKHITFYSARLNMGAATMPPGIACDHPLPASLGTSHFSLTVVGPLEASNTHRRPKLDFSINGERLENGNLVGRLGGNITDSLCNHRYSLVATIAAKSRRLVFAYPFLVSDVAGVAGTCPT